MGSWLNSLNLYGLYCRRSSRFELHCFTTPLKGLCVPRRLRSLCAGFVHECVCVCSFWVSKVGSGRDAYTQMQDCVCILQA